MYQNYKTEQYNFKCSVKKSILHCLQMLSELKPIQVADDNISQEDFYEGQKEFYEFVEKLYCLMLSDPDKFLISTNEYDTYIQSDKAKKKREKEHYTDAKESNLRNKFQQAIQFYSKFLYDIGIAAESINPADYSLVISKDKMLQIKDGMMSTHINKDNELRYKKIRELGIQIKEDNNFCIISSEKYPKMFLGLWVLCKAKESKYHYLNYLRVDYEGTKKESPDIQDILETVREEHQKIINELQKALPGNKVRMKIKPFNAITSRSKWKAEYRYKGKNILGFYAAPDNMMICIYFNSHLNIANMSKRLQEENYDLYQWYKSKFPERLCKCRYNRRVQFGEEYQRICGFSNRAEIKNPTDQDLNNSIEVIKLFRDYR